MLNNSRKRWTKEEDILLISSYGVITYNQIGKEIGRTKDAVEKRIRVLEKEGKISNNKLHESREKKFIKRFENMYPGFAYHSGYKNVDKPFKSKCNTCGYIQERSGQCTRPKFIGTSLTCDRCDEIRRIERERQAEEERRMKEEQSIKERLIQLLLIRKEYIEREQLLQKVCSRCGNEYKAYRINSIHCDICLNTIMQERKELRSQWEGKIVECDECGKEFEMITYNSKYCSLKCLNRAMDRKHVIRKRKRLKKNGRVDVSITLSKLIQRDKGICKVCGCLIDEEDYKFNDNGNFIVGRKYPSVDHIIPINKGGTHTWNNVQLAHHYCNSLKGDNIYKRVEEDGQLRII